MASTYSFDLRERVAAYILSGHSRRAAARVFGVSESFAVKLMRRIDRTGSIEPDRRGRPRGTGKLEAYGPYVIGLVEEQPDITLPEICDRLEAEHGVRVWPASLSRFLRKAGFSYKKTLLASEQERADVLAQRRLWITRRQPLMRLEAHRLVFLDETATTTKMVRLRGRAKRGERLRGSAPFGHWRTQTFIAGLRCDGLIAPWVLNCPMTRRAFETYVETQLAPTLHPGTSSFSTTSRHTKVRLPPKL